MSVIASINLNKRINDPAARTRLNHWLDRNGVRVLLVQEPWRLRKEPGADFEGWTSIGGNDRVFAWIESRIKPPGHTLVEEFWQRIELGYLVVHNVYLDASSRSVRARQITQVTKGIEDEGNRPVLLVGDFNIAPTPTEGLFAGKPSDFNSKVDRGPLLQLLESGRLIDLGASTTAWTFERKMQTGQVQFRCDLALASDYIAHSIKFGHDSATRLGKEAFTDHSGLLIDVPVTIGQATGDVVESAKTAIRRKDVSPISRQVFQFCQKHPSIRSILDFGCGYGEDVRFYRKKGMPAEGYDPYPSFGWSKQPDGKFDLVTFVFVLNVLPDPWTRLKAFAEAAGYLSPGGLMIVVTRSPSEINREAAKKGWTPLNDGYWSHKGKSTFQKGISREEILVMASRLGLELSPVDRHFSVSAAASCVVFQLKTRPTSQ